MASLGVREIWVFIFSLTPEEAMVDDLAKACGTKKIKVKVN